MAKNIEHTLAVKRILLFTRVENLRFAYSIERYQKPMVAAYNVFVSSTSEDLCEYREVVKQVIEELGLTAIMMEEFPAEDSAAVDACKHYVNQADVYLGIYAHRYGWIPSQDQGGNNQDSITALEYKWASERGIPRLCFLIYDEYPWPEQFKDDEPKRTLLREFKTKLESEVIRKTFTTADSLARGAKESLSKWLGWQAPEPPVFSYRYMGRESLLTQLEEILSNHNRMALIGIGGIGKTMTATRLAHWSQVKPFQELSRVAKAGVNDFWKAACA